MKYNLLLSFFLLSIASNAQTTTFSGRILSNSGRSPIPYAHIALKNTTIGAISNEYGFFKLTIPTDKLNNGQFIVSAIGFKSLSIIDMGSWNKELKLMPLITELDEITVSGNKMQLTAKDLVKSAIKTGLKLDKNLSLALDIEQVAQHNGIITRHYFNVDIKLTREESIPYSIPEINNDEIEYSYDVGALPTASSIVSPHWVLSTDFYTLPKLRKAKGKYLYKFTDTQEIDGREVFEVTVLQQADTMSHSATWKTDYKFYFSTKNFDLLRFEKREIAIYEYGYNHMYESETTVSNYDDRTNDDPLTDITIENIQYLTRYNRSKQVIQVDRSSQLTSGRITIPNTTKIAPVLKKEYHSTLDAIDKNTKKEKLYLYLFWDESEGVFYDNRLVLFQLLEDYTYDELEIVCLGSPQKRSQWQINAHNFPFFSHYYVDELSKFTDSPSKQCQLFSGKDLLISTDHVSEKILNAIKKLN